MEGFLPLLDELTPAFDTLNNVRVINELDLKSPVNVVRVPVFVNEKPNDHSLLGLHPAMKNRSIQKRSHFRDRCSLEARAGGRTLVLGRYTVSTIQQRMKLDLEVGGYAPGHYVLPSRDDAHSTAGLFQ
jgi:hypothetical protein